MSNTKIVRTQKDLQDQLTEIAIRHGEAYNTCLKAIEGIPEELKTC